MYGLSLVVACGDYSLVVVSRLIVALVSFAVEHWL